MMIYISTRHNRFPQVPAASHGYPFGCSIFSEDALQNRINLLERRNLLWNIAPGEPDIELLRVWKHLRHLKAPPTMEGQPAQSQPLFDGGTCPVRVSRWLPA